MACTGSMPTYDGDFWEVSQNDNYLTSDNNYKGVSIWCDLGNIWSLVEKLRVGDRLEFSSRNLPRAQWAIYVGEWESLCRGVVHFIPGNKAGRAYSDMKSIPASKDVLVVNSIFDFVSLPNGKVRINSLRDTDKDWSPLDERHIRKEISYQLEELHKSYERKKVYLYMCRGTFKDSEAFVNYCRYDGDHQHNWRINNYGILSAWHTKANIEGFTHELRVGDKLEFGRQYPYERWGMYIGKWGDNVEQVVHIAPGDVNEDTDVAMTSSNIGSSAKETPVLCVASIGTALGADKVRINNEGDWNWSPVDSENMLEEISSQLPGKMCRHRCKVSFKDSEDFVNFCRYDDWRINFGLVSDWCDSWQSLPWLRVGDRLQFRRTARLYTHWGIYVGDWGNDRHQVVHFTPVNGIGKIFSTKKTFGSGSSAKNKPMLCVHHIDKVIGKNTVRINNERDQTWPPVVWTDILNEVLHQLRRQSDGHPLVYNLLQNNCEHFVNHCRYGEHRSDQARPFSKIRD